MPRALCTTLSKKEVEFVQYVIDGMTRQEARARTGVGRYRGDTVLELDAAKKMMREQANAVIRAAKKRAAKKLSEQIDSEDKWIAQNAAREVLNQADKLDGGGQAQIVVNFVNMPTPGMPIQIPDADGDVE